MIGDKRAGLPRISLARMEAFGDSVCVRDSKGHSLRPALVRSRSGDALEVHGSFAVIQRFSVSPGEGRLFVEASRDANPIHTEGSVVPGAMTAARAILLPEMLLPGLAVRTLRLKFRAFSLYGRPSVNRFTFKLAAAGGFHISVAVLQAGSLVAEGEIQGVLRPEVPETSWGVPPRTPETSRGVPPRTPVAPGEAEAARSRIIESFFRSLRLHAGSGFAALGFTYPRAFLASLPSGEMVRIGGVGGLLNLLDLEFPEIQGPTAEGPPPEAEVGPARRRSSFWKVLTRVGKGMITYCRGHATVFADALGGASLAGARG